MICVISYMILNKYCTKDIIKVIVIIAFDHSMKKMYLIYVLVMWI